MTVLQAAAGAAAVVVALAPQLKQAAAYASALIKRVPSVPASGPTYQQAIDSLASVRLRLRSTDCLGDDQKAAINALTLALVEGSDK